MDFASVCCNAHIGDDVHAESGAAIGDAAIRSLPLKRCLDIAVSASTLAFFAPAMVGIWVAVRLTSRGPGLFWSERVGRNGDIFMMPKFRSMETGTEVISREILDDDQARVTALGGFLRLTSLDELPQLWSVLRGRMSLVGPRALLPNDIAIPERERFPVIASVRPGITGLAQIRGRNAVSPRRKARYDRFYARRVSSRLDMHILKRTVWRVLLCRDII